MATPAVLKVFYGITVTLADTAVHNLYDLLVAIDDSLAALQQNVGALSIQADDSNGSNGVLIGDSLISASPRCAYRLLVHDQNPYQSPQNMQIPLKAIYVLAEGATCKLNVQIIIP